MHRSVALRHTQLSGHAGILLISRLPTSTITAVASYLNSVVSLTQGTVHKQGILFCHRSLQSPLLKSPRFHLDSDAATDPVTAMQPHFHASHSNARGALRLAPSTFHGHSPLHTTIPHLLRSSAHNQSFRPLPYHRSLIHSQRLSHSRRRTAVHCRSQSRVVSLRCRSLRL